MVLNDLVLEAVHCFLQDHGEPEEDAGGHGVHESEARQLFPPVDHHLLSTGDTVSILALVQFQ